MADEYILRSIAVAKLTALEVTDPFATIADAKRVLADMDAADVASVAHGKWGDNGIAGSMLVKCSVCDFDCGANSFSYCPNCGARMRQAKRGEGSAEVWGDSDSVPVLRAGWDGRPAGTAARRMGGSVSERWRLCAARRNIRNA